LADNQLTKKKINLPRFAGIAKRGSFFVKTLNAENLGEVLSYNLFAPNQTSNEVKYE